MSLLSNLQQRGGAFGPFTSILLPTSPVMCAFRAILGRRSSRGPDPRARICGRNGCGKSTLMTLICSEMNPTENKAFGSLGSLVALRFFFCLFFFGWSCYVDCNWPKLAGVSSYTTSIVSFVAGCTVYPGRKAGRDHSSLQPSSVLDVADGRL